MAELAEQLHIYFSQFTQWKSQLLEHAAQVFGELSWINALRGLKAFHANIGELAQGNEF